jgi:lysophospholipase L1-like esterase
MLTNTLTALEKGDPVIISAIGDSLTAGWMVRKGYLDFFEEMLKNEFPASKVKINNRGVPGDTADGGLDRLRDDVIDDDPDLVLVQFGLNDLYMGYPVSRFRNNIEAIVQSTKDNCSAEIMLLTSGMINNRQEMKAALEFYEAIASTSMKLNTALARVDLYWKRAVDSGTALDSLLQFDGVHPTVEGYRLMAEALMETLLSQKGKQ